MEEWPLQRACVVGEAGVTAPASLESAVECLRDIAAMGRKAGSETAKNWLYQHGYPLEEGGYVPGRGYASDYESQHVSGCAKPGSITADGKHFYCLECGRPA